MSRFDTIVMVDWSAAATAPKTGRADTIWAAIARDGAVGEAAYLGHRIDAEAWLTDLFEAELAAGRRVLAGFDFPFGYPAGFAEALTGHADPFALWDWLEARIEDSRTANNRFDIAAEINARLPGIGPFWGNGLKRDIPHLPRLGTDRRDMPFPERRRAEMAAPRAFPVWQLSGAGAVGGQVLMGLPVLARLRRRFAGHVSVWPFEHPDTPLVIAEVWPSLLADEVQAALTAQGGIKDARQVELLAAAIAGLSEADLAALLAVEDTEEGWILGAEDPDRLKRGLAPPAPPPLKNDCFALPPGVDWTPVDEALDRLKHAIHPVVPRERRETATAAGRILATPVTAARANPPAPNSAVDGYGFAHAATGDGPQVLPLAPGRAAAGAPFDGVVPKGHALRILTGAVMPDGVDTVVLEEDVTTSGGRIAFQGPIKAKANTRKAGEDVAEGDDVLPAGRRLTPADLALLSAVGRPEVDVFAPLRVGVLSTGDELAAPGATADPARTYDANRPMLLAMADRWGYQPVDLGHVGDDRAALRARLDEGADRADAILTSGGASAGDEDHVSALLSEAGAMETWRIALKPGRPLALGLWNGTPVFGLPGNPVAAFVCTLIFARPAFSVLAGGSWTKPVGFTVPAAFEKRKKPGRREYLRARINGNGQAEVFASEGSGRISGLSWAEGLVEIEDGERHIKPGDPVRYLPFGSFGF